jgi:D-alanine-D-alanine ligase-like ATP-grasp enzyme
MTVRVNVCMGGPSVEHEISLLSGLEVMANIDRNVYMVRAVVISARKEFYCCDVGDRPLTLADLGDPRASGRFAGPFPATASAPVWEQCDAAFLALHGSLKRWGYRIPARGSSPAPLPWTRSPRSTFL